MIQCRHRSFAVCLVSLAAAAHAARAPRSVDLAAPIMVYSDLPAYAGPTDANRLDETNALRDLDELVRLRKSGLRFDYDLMPASWFAPGGAYRALRPQDWPNGPDAWISKCREAGIRPGLEIGANTLPSAQPASALPPPWQDSLGRDGRSLSLFEGGYLHDLVTALQFWYDRGVRLFEIGPIDLTAATPASAARLNADNIVVRNSAALRDALTVFRRENRDAVVLLLAGSAASPDTAPPLPAANHSSGTAATPRPEIVELGAFQLLQTGESRLSAAPQANLARVIDIESDGRVRHLEQLGLPLQHIDSMGFTVTASQDRGLREPQQAWKGAFLVSMARGGWVNTLHGDLQRIRAVDAFWMARVQKLFLTLQAQGRVRSFGGSPGSGRPYGFAAATKRGSIYVVVNPGFAVAQLTLPSLTTGQPLRVEGRIQFRDAGFMPRLRGDTITLGPGEMAMVGYGAYTEPGFNLGVQQDVVIPNSIEPVDADFESTAPATFEASIEPPIEGVLRVIVHERANQNQVVPNASASTQPAERSSLAFSIEVTQSGRPIPVRINGDDSVNSGSVDGAPLWLVAEIDVNDLTPGMPVRVLFHSNSVGPADLEGRAYQVVY